MSVLLDADFDRVKPEVKVEALKNLAGFLGLHTVSLYVYSPIEYDQKIDETS